MNENSTHPPAWATVDQPDPVVDPQFGYPQQDAPAAPAEAYVSDPAAQAPYGYQPQHAQPPYQPQPDVPYGHTDPQSGFTPPAGMPAAGMQAPVMPNPGMQAPAYGPVDGQQQPQQGYPQGVPPQGYAPQGYGQAPQAPAPASRPGWRRSLQGFANNFVAFGGTRKKDEIAQLADRVRQPIRNDFRVAVLSLKGGVGKTTVTVGLGSALASLRGDRVIAVDANPDLGTLARRIPAQTASTVRDLLQDEHLERYMDVRKHTSQAPSRLEVLASERDPAISEAFTEDEYLQVIEILENHYNMILTDCGTGLVQSAMAGVMKSATALVLVTSPALDGAQSAVATLDWLVAHGYEQIARETVVVIAASKTRNAPVDVNMLREYFLGRTRAVQIIPYDEHLAIGGFIDLNEMKPATRSAFLELAATMVQPFAIQPPPAYYGGPFGGMPPQGAPMPGAPMQAQPQGVPMQAPQQGPQVPQV
ncbi:MinD/ParA family ATP-binding protein [Gordonia phthalatica]|uniref:MinD/ParA family ATP-binding protein n=1 Tax=Gordonia phthalatica TaxID=1136941 RepID=UPI000782C3B1|nr:MinD/ParA family protein [Gordonia phthalatica]